MKEITSLLSSQFGFGEWDKELMLVKRRDKLWVVQKKALEQDISNMRAELVGVYFGTLERSGLRLSIEGSQLVGPKSSENIVQIDGEQLHDWLRGFDLDVEISSVYVLLKHGTNFVGCGKRKGNQVMNTVPKSRRIRKL